MSIEVFIAAFRLTAQALQDVLCELLLKLRLDLAVAIETRQIAGKTVHKIGAGALMACLSDGIDTKLPPGHSHNNRSG